MSHNVFLMLQETNKFREHQSRELLIEILEKQLEKREKFIDELEDKISKADALLLDEDSLKTIEIDESWLWNLDQEACIIPQKKIWVYPTFSINKMFNF